MGLHEAYKEVLGFLSVPRTEQEIKDYLKTKIKDTDSRHQTVFGSKLSKEEELCQTTKVELSNLVK